MWDLLTSLDAWAALVSLAALEIVLGIDNVVFISILVVRLDAQRSETARRLGLGLALIFRIALLFALTSLLGLSAPVFTLWGNAFCLGRGDCSVVGGVAVSRNQGYLHLHVVGIDDEQRRTEVRVG